MHNFTNTHVDDVTGLLVFLTHSRTPLFNNQEWAITNHNPVARWMSLLTRLNRNARSDREEWIYPAAANPGRPGLKPLKTMR